ncbi:hypothetical protein BT93_C1949 [Corymbia citriodora subsp. variegata]|nr:hypothetical protein BT93_C1949 [Corymbia citriodora subsp. variegata]
MNRWRRPDDARIRKDAVPVLSAKPRLVDEEIAKRFVLDSSPQFFCLPTNVGEEDDRVWLTPQLTRVADDGFGMIIVEFQFDSGSCLMGSRVECFSVRRISISLFLMGKKEGKALIVMLAWF